MSPHPDAGVLVRLVDGEVSSAEHAQLVAHREQCADCARELGSIEARSQALVALLERTDPQPRRFTLTPRRRPPKRLSRVWSVAAAVVLALGAAAFLTTPVRAWILERLADMRRVIGVREPATRVQLPAPVDSASRVSFVPVSDVLVVRVAQRQSEGSLLLEGTDSLAVSAEVAAAGNGVGVELIVLPGELRIANASQSRASYRIAVPTRVKQVIVSIGGEAPAVVAPLRSRERHTIAISRIP